MRMVSVIFDLEGTLVQSVPMTDRAILEFRKETRRTLVELGVPKEILADAETSTLMRNRAKEYADSNLTVSEKRGLMEGLDRFLLGYELKWAQDSTRFSDTVPTLRTLRSRGIKMAVVTNTSTQAAEAILSKHELADYFTTVVTRNDVELLKPDPQGTLLAIERLHDRNPVFVGDLPVDIEAARGAGIKSVLVKRDWPNHAFPSNTQPDHVVGSLSEIPVILEEICSL